MSFGRRKSWRRMSDPGLDFERITVAYGQLIAIRDVSLTARRGAVVAILGANGAGKSTLLRAASGLLRPTAGTIH